MVNELCAPHERADRLLCPTRADFELAATSLSKLRERGRPISGNQTALLDALIAAVARREGALLVTGNLRDFRALSTVVPLKVETLDDFRLRLEHDA